MRILPPLLLAGLLGTVLPAPAQPDPVAGCPFLAVPPEGELAREAPPGPFASDRAYEDFLRQAPVEEIVDIGEGITRPRRLTLDDGEGRCRAIFKTVDVQEDRISYTDRFEMNFTDRWVYEVAAYRLDRLLGLGLVPVTVRREVNGETGSVQAWVENAVSAQEAIENDLPIRDLDRYFLRVLFTRILDALIYNIDRNNGNILITPENEGYYLIDHSRAFRIYKKIPERDEDWARSVPPGLVARLEALDLASLERALGDLLEPSRIRPILKRRDHLLRDLRRRGLLGGSKDSG